MTVSEPNLPSWVELLTLMVDGPEPEPTVRGAIRSRPGADQDHGAIGWYAYAGPGVPDRPNAGTSQSRRCIDGPMSNSTGRSTWAGPN
jgi:hypothetical protein